MSGKRSRGVSRPTRRRFALAALAALAPTAGCLGTTRRVASPVTVARETVAATPYEFAGIESRESRRRVGVGPATRRVTVVSRVATYDRAVAVPGVGSSRIAAFVALSTPAVRVLGTDRNPVANASPRELAARLAAERDRLTVGERTGERSVRTLGKATALVQFAGTTRVGPVGVPTTVHVARVTHDDDHVVATAAHPSWLDERWTVARLVEGLTHE